MEYIMGGAEFTVKNYRCFEDTQPLRFIFEKGFTAFIGTNNSGKSSILKFFYEFRHLWSLVSQPTGNFLNALQGRREEIGINGVYDQTEVFCNLNNRDLEIEVEFPPTELPQKDPPLINKFQITISRIGPSWTASLWIPGRKLEFQGAAFHPGNNNFLQDQGIVLADLSSLFEFFKSLFQSMYIGAFRNAINIGAAEGYFDINVGTAFIATWHNWKTGPEKRLNDAIQKVSKDIQHIFGYDNLEIIASNELKTLQVYANGKSYKLQELGAGITQFIVVLGNAAIRQPSFILIDEPELNLHPGLQLDFLTSLASYSRDGVVFATHSIGLARSAADRIYSLQNNNGRGIIRPFEQTTNLAEFLGELSFISFKELGFDKVLLVEGVNEIKTIQQFLRLLKKDHEVILLPLGGSQMINGSVEYELNEIKRISSNILALIDSERDKEGAPLSDDRQAFGTVCSELGIKVHALERRAIENYFTERAIQEIKGPGYKALEPYQKLENSPRPWAKHENWKIARAMTFNEIEHTDLGEFLKSF